MNLKQFIKKVLNEIEFDDETKNDFTQHSDAPVNRHNVEVQDILTESVIESGGELRRSFMRYEKLINKLVYDVFDEGICGLNWEVFKLNYREGISLRIILHFTEESFQDFDYERYGQSKQELKVLIEDFLPKFDGIYILFDTTKCNDTHKKEMSESELTERCWKGYTQKGMKTMFGKRYPNCVKIKKKKSVRESIKNVLDEEVKSVDMKTIQTELSNLLGPSKLKDGNRVEFKSYIGSFDSSFNVIVDHLDQKTLDFINNFMSEKGWFPTNIGLDGLKDHIYSSNFKNYIGQDDVQIGYEANTGKELISNKSRAYHVTTDTFVNNILENGIVTKSESKLSNHPERVYLYFDKDMSKDMVTTIWNSLSKERQQTIKDYYILEIDLTKLPNHKFYHDPASTIGLEAIYTDQSIPKSAVKEVGKISTKDLKIYDDYDDEVLTLDQEKQKREEIRRKEEERIKQDKEREETYKEYEKTMEEIPDEIKNMSIDDLLKENIRRILKESVAPQVRRRQEQFDRIFEHYKDSFKDHPFKTFESFWNLLMETSLETLYHAWFSKTVSDDDWEESAEYIEKYLIKKYYDDTEKMWKKIHRKKINESDDKKEKSIESLEKSVTKFINMHLEDYDLPEEFYKVAVDVFDSEYGRKECKVTMLFEKPFKMVDSDRLHIIMNIIKKEIKEYFGHTFWYIQLGSSTVEIYNDTKDWYEKRKKNINESKDKNIEKNLRLITKLLETIDIDGLCEIWVEYNPEDGDYEIRSTTTNRYYDLADMTEELDYIDDTIRSWKLKPYIFTPNYVENCEDEVEFMNESDKSKQEIKFTKLLNNIEEYLNSNSYKSVVRFMVDYDEVMDDVIVNIFFDSEKARELGGGINSVIKRTGKKIMEDLSVFPFDFKYHIHFEKPHLNESIIKENKDYTKLIKSIIDSSDIFDYKHFCGVDIITPEERTDQYNFLNKNKIPYLIKVYYVGGPNSEVWPRTQAVHYKELGLMDELYGYIKSFVPFNIEILRAYVNTCDGYDKLMKRKYTTEDIQESIRRILREETNQNTRRTDIGRDIDTFLFDDLYDNILGSAYFKFQDYDIWFDSNGEEITDDTTNQILNTIPIQQSFRTFEEWKDSEWYYNTEFPFSNKDWSTVKSADKESFKWHSTGHKQMEEKIFNSYLKKYGRFIVVNLTDK